MNRRLVEIESVKYVGEQLHQFVESFEHRCELGVSEIGSFCQEVVEVGFAYVLELHQFVRALLDILTIEHRQLNLKHRFKIPCSLPIFRSKWLDRPLVLGVRIIEGQSLLPRTKVGINIPKPANNEALRLFAL